MSQSRPESETTPKTGLAKLSELVKLGSSAEIKNDSAKFAKIAAEIKNIIAEAKAAESWNWYNTKEKYVEIAMRDAILSENSEILRLFLDAGMRADTWADSESPERSTQKLIGFAAQTGSLPIVQLLIAHKADIEPRNEYYDKGDDTAIRAAIEYNQLHIVNYLLEMKASAHGVFRGMRDLNFLAKAAEMRHIEVVELLVKKGAKPESAISFAHSKYKDEGRWRREKTTEWKEEYNKTIKILLDHAPGMDLDQEGTGHWYGGQYGGLSFLHGLDITDFNLVGVSVAGTPITHAMLNEAKLVGADLAIVNLSDLKKIKESVRVEKIQSLLEEAINKQGEIIKDGIVNLVPLDRAAEIGDEKTVQVRLQAGVDPNSGESSPLILAAKMGHTNIVALLLKDTRLKKETLPAALKVAQDKGHKIICEMLKEQQDVNQKDDNGYSLLHIAIARGEIEEVASLILRKADVNLDGPKGYPLDIAASKSYDKEYRGEPSTNHIAILQLLLDANANPNRISWGETALSRAASAGSAAAVKMLLPVTEKRDIKFDPRGLGRDYKYLPWYTEMLFYSHRSKEWLEILTTLKAHGANLNILDKYGRVSLLHIALRNFPSLSDIRSTMRGLSFSIRGAEDRVPSNALEEEQAKLVADSREIYFKHLLELDILLLNGVDPNIQDNEGRTALHIFIESVDLRHVEDGFSQVLDRFIKKGFKINLQNKYGRTILHKAAEKGDFRAVESILMQDGVDINIADNEKRTPLHLAAVGSPITTKMLISKGADIQAMTKDGETPLAFSRKCCESDQKRYKFSSDEAREEFIKPYTEAQDHLQTAEAALAKAKLEEKSIGFFAPPKRSEKTVVEVKSPSTPPMTVVLDLDDSFVTPIRNKQSDSKLINEFTKHGLCIEAHETPHLIHPGALEFIKLLFSTPNIRVAFFSSAIKKRNEEVVPKLLKLALGEIEYKKIMAKGGVKIASQDDLVPGSDQSKLVSLFGSWFSGNQKKDLNKIVKTPEELSNTVFIEDDPSYIMQGKNLLHVDTTHGSLHFHLAKKCKKLSDKALSVNHVFYATGLLLAAIKKSTTDKISLSEALYAIQPKVMATDTTAAKLEYYHLGLQELRKINPTLDFMSANFSLSPQSSQIGIEADKKAAALHLEIEKQASLTITI